MCIKKYAWVWDIMDDVVVDYVRQKRVVIVGTAYSLEG